MNRIYIIYIIIDGKRKGGGGSEERGRERQTERCLSREKAGE